MATDPQSMTWMLWAGGACAAFLVGLSKSGVPGLGILVVPVMAMIWPTRTSVGALLPLLVTGDILAIAAYRRHAEWRRMLPLVPWVALGMGAAAWLLPRLGNTHFRPLLGSLVLAMTGLELTRRFFRWDQLPRHPLFGAVSGTSAGFATTVGNAAGPIMNLYMLSRGFTKERFVGTIAWFFFFVNLSKVPIFLAMNMITPQTLRFDALVVPAVAVGAWTGVRLMPHIPQRLFNGLVVVLTIAAALKLLLG